MGRIKKQILQVPIDEVNGIDELFGRITKIKVNNVPVKFREAFDKTKQTAYECFKMKCIYESFEVESIEDEKIILKKGLILKSDLMAQMFCHAFDLAVIVLTLNGYDEADEAEVNMLNKLFLDAWGTAFVECGSTWIKNNIANDLEAKGLYLTNSFSPGQNNIPMEIQEIVFQLLSPEEIHVTLSDKFMMHPKKSISSILGIQYCKDVYNICACDLCVRKDTCPNAYS